MDNESEPEAGATATALSPPRMGKREGEDEDEKQVIAKKQKRDDVAEEQKDKEHSNSDYSEHDKKLEAGKSEPATSCGSSESLDDGSLESGSDRKSVEDNGTMDIDEGDSFEESDEEAQKKKMEAVPVNDLESSEYNEEEIEEKASKTPWESPKAQATLKASKTIYVRNLSYSVERADMEDLFKDCGDVVDVRLHTDREGRFKGFGHVEFGTAEAAQKALQLDNTELLRNRIIVGIAREKGEYTPNRSLFHKDARFQSQTIYVKGFGTSFAENKAITPATPNEKNTVSKTIYVRNLSYNAERADMENLFKDCGEIVDVRLQTDHEGRFKGFGHVEFATIEAAQKALELDNTELLNRRIRVGIAREKGEYTLNRSNLTSSFHFSERFQSQTAFVKSSDTSLAEDMLTCEKEVKDVETFDAASVEKKVDINPASPKEKNAVSKTIYVRNLSYSVERADVENLFKHCGEIVDVRLQTDREGRFIGFGHVEFATSEAAQRALQLDNTELLNRRIRVGIARERGEYILNRSERFQPQTAFVKSSDTSLAEDKLTCEKEVKDVETFDAASVEKKVPETPATAKERNAVAKTICVRNLSYKVERVDIENVFKDCGEVVDIRLHMDHDGRSKGFAHVRFATAEAAQKALELDHTELLKRPIKVDIAEKHEYVPNRSNWSNSFQKGERFQSLTVFVIGFDTSLAEEKIKASLEEHFSSCGEITRISIPTFRDSGAVRGFAHLDFKDFDGWRKALQLHRTELGGYPLSVEKAKAKPRHENQAIGSGSYHFGGRDRDDHGGRVGWWRSGGGGRHWTPSTDEGTGWKTSFAGGGYGSRC